jgi:hypothetical protein
MDTERERLFAVRRSLFAEREGSLKDGLVEVELLCLNFAPISCKFEETQML